MGLFNKLFGKKRADTQNYQDKKPDVKLSEIEPSKIEVKPEKREVFLGKDQEEIKNYFKKLSSDNDPLENNLGYQNFIKSKSNLEYNLQDLELIENFIISNMYLSEKNYFNVIESIIQKIEARLRRRDFSFDSDEKIFKAIIKFLNGFKNSEIVFCIQDAHWSEFLFVDNNKLFFASCSTRYIELSNIYDIDIIYNFFSRPYYFKGIEDKKVYERRYNLLNSNIGNYINELFEILKNGDNNLSEHEFDFNFNSEYFKLNEFIEYVKRFLFYIELYDHLILPHIESQINNSLKKINIDSENRLILPENAFDKLIRKNQTEISEIDKSYIHKFVKLSSYINKKKENIEIFFERVDRNNHKEALKRLGSLEDQIPTYETLLFHSINMVGALMDRDLVSFYEIYEVFDKLGIFNSNWENEVSGKLTDIGKGINDLGKNLDDLINSIHSMENNIVNELSNLSYVTQESFNELNQSVSKQLHEVKSSIDTNNLLSVVQTYQLYKINKQTKSLN